MTQCPHCAEDIYDADPVCNNCGRDRTADQPAGQPAGEYGAAAAGLSPRRTRAAKIGRLVLAGLVVAGTIGVAGSPSLRTALERAARQLPFRRQPRTQIVSIATVSELEIGSGKLARFDWTVPQAQPHCHLVGHIEVTSGGNKNIQIFVVSAYDYKNLATGRAAKTYLPSDKTSAIDLNVHLNTPGPMTLVIGNTFGPLAAKRVQLRDVKATCT